MAITKIERLAQFDWYQQKEENRATKGWGHKVTAGYKEMRGVLKGFWYHFFAKLPQGEISCRTLKHLWVREFKHVQPNRFSGSRLRRMPLRCLTIWQQQGLCGGDWLKECTLPQLIHIRKLQGELTPDQIQKLSKAQLLSLYQWAENNNKDELLALLRGPIRILSPENKWELWQTLSKLSDKPDVLHTKLITQFFTIQDLKYLTERVQHPIDMLFVLEIAKMYPEAIQFDACLPRLWQHCDFHDQRVQKLFLKLSLRSNNREFLTELRCKMPENFDSFWQEQLDKPEDKTDAFLAAGTVNAEHQKQLITYLCKAKVEKWCAFFSAAEEQVPAALKSQLIKRWIETKASQTPNLEQRLEACYPFLNDAGPFTVTLLQQLTAPCKKSSEHAKRLFTAFEKTKHPILLVLHSLLIPPNPTSDDKKQILAMHQQGWLAPTIPLHLTDHLKLKTTAEKSLFIANANSWLVKDLNVAIPLEVVLNLITPTLDKLKRRDQVLNPIDAPSHESPPPSPRQKNPSKSPKTSPRVLCRLGGFMPGHKGDQHQQADPPPIGRAHSNSFSAAVQSVSNKVKSPLCHFHKLSDRALCGPATLFYLFSSPDHSKKEISKILEKLHSFDLQGAPHILQEVLTYLIQKNEQKHLVTLIHEANAIFNNGNNALDQAWITKTLQEKGNLLLPDLKTLLNKLKS
ncbi:MAG: hypothetical protein KDK65_03150 [Chlamydiia bacterium]|nr:hypothetical protein [Chlamydiia bacterium]